MCVYTRSGNALHFFSFQQDQRKYITLHYNILSNVYVELPMDI